MHENARNHFGQLEFSFFFTIYYLQKWFSLAPQFYCWWSFYIVWAIQKKKKEPWDLDRLYLRICLFGGAFLFQKLESSIAVQPMPWIQMINNSNICNMQIIEEKRKLCFPINRMEITKTIVSCITNDKHNAYNISESNGEFNPVAYI